MNGQESGAESSQPQLPSTEDLQRKYEQLSSEIRSMRGTLGTRSKAKTALVVGAAVIGVSAISIGANKLWAWAFPTVPDRRR